MGLDAVELVLRVEDEFKISIDNDEAANVRTVGDLFQIVLSKLDTTPSCLSSKAFYRTRQALVECLQVPRRSIRPTTWLDSILPESSRPQIWQEIGDRVDLAFPRMQYASKWKTRFHSLSATVSALLVLAILAFVLHFSPLSFANILVWIPAFAAWLILFTLLNWQMQQWATPLRTELPCQTAGELSRMVLTANYEYFSPTAKQNEAPSKEYVWKRLVEIIADQLQVESEEVLPAARFSEDLGVD